MWSRFEKLKDNITQIASDVLDSQDDDDDLDGEGVLDDDSLDELYNAPQSLFLRDRGRDSDGEDGSSVFRPKEENRNGHVDVVKEQPVRDEALVVKVDTVPEKVSDDHYIATNGFDSPEKTKLDLSSLNGKATNGFQESPPLLSVVDVNDREYIANEQELRDDSPHKESQASHGGSPLKESQSSDEGSPHKESPSSHEGSPHKESPSSHEGSPHKESPSSHGGSPHKESPSSHEGPSDKALQASDEGPSAKESHALRALAEQVKSLSERLRTSGDVCCSLQSKLDAVSIERDTISRRLEEVLLEPEAKSKELEKVIMERDSLSKKVEEVSLERDKALQNLGRLRQNLLDMESSTSEKMDNDTILIGDLELRLKTAEECVSKLQQALAISQDDLAVAIKNNALMSMGTNEEMELLKQRLQACSDALESKDMELANLQSALGQYYAESDAQERLESELRAVRELNSRLTRDLKIADETMDLKVKELDTATKKLASADALNVELKHTMHKLQQDVLKLRAALEQSITSLNRMSSDSDFYVDRRIVIKLLVTYFQRHHSREVLDLMVRMLGFSEEDKRRVGVAQQNARGGGMVRSVFGVPGRIVGGILGSSDPETSPRAAPGDNQSFADMWIDFLLKESQERERRERGETGANAAPISPMANITRSMPSSPSGGGYHKPSSSFSGFPSSFLLPPKPSRVSSSTDLESILTGETTDDASS